MILDDCEYLSPPDNEAEKVLRCFLCKAWIYEGDKYYLIDGVEYCEDCLNETYKRIAELPDYEAIKAEMDYEDMKEKGEI